MKELVGRIITGIRVAPDQSELLFDTDKGPVKYSTEADCCSESWFADITGVHAIIGAQVRQAEEVENMAHYNVEDGRTRQEYDSAYGWKLTTDKGHADIVFRNSSNGYYGGWMNKASDTKAKGFTPITDDWRA